MAAPAGRHPLSPNDSLMWRIESDPVLRSPVVVVALLDRWFVIDLAWLFDLWPVALLLVGGWLIWGSLRDRRKARPVRDSEY